MTAETACRLWVMERAVYVAVKRAYTAQLAAQKRELLDRVPMLGTLSQVRVTLASTHCGEPCPRDSRSKPLIGLQTGP